MADDYTRFSRLVLKDGTVLNNCSCGYANKELWCFLKDRTLFDAIQLFSGPEKFQTIVYEFGIPINYTRITYMSITGVVTFDQQETQTDVRLVGDNITQTEETILSVPEKDEPTPET